MELIDNGGDCGTEEALESVSLLNLSFSLKWLAFTWKATSSEISHSFWRTKLSECSVTLLLALPFGHYLFNIFINNLIQGNS